MLFHVDTHHRIDPRSYTPAVSQPTPPYHRNGTGSEGSVNHPTSLTPSYHPPRAVPAAPLPVFNTSMPVTHCLPVRPPLPQHTSLTNMDELCHSADEVCGIAIPSSTLEDPQRVRKAGPYTMLYCGKCADWVNTKAKNLRSARPHFGNHQSSNKCKERCNARQAWAIQHASQIQQPLLPLPPPETSSGTSRIHPGCPGVPLDWPSEHPFFTDYPFNRHHPGSRFELPWLLHMWDSDHGVMHIRSPRCAASGSVDGHVCAACNAVRSIANIKIKGILSRQDVLSTTNYELRSWATLNKTALHHRIQRSHAEQNVSYSESEQNVDEANLGCSLVSKCTSDNLSNEATDT
jgi:hypothetical protein